MPTAIRAGMLLGLALAFAAGAVDAAAQGMGSGPIQTLPWAAKQRPKPNPNKEGQRGVDADTQPVETSPAEPIAGPVATKPRN